MTSNETKRNVGVMKKAWLLVLCLIWMLPILFLSGCTTSDSIKDPDNISLDDISIDDGMRVTATVNIKNIDLENFRNEEEKNTLNSITVVYAYTQDTITALEENKDFVGQIPVFPIAHTSIPDNIQNGSNVFNVPEAEITALKNGTETSYSKQLEFIIPKEAKGKKIDFFVVLTGTDDDVDGMDTSGIFTYLPAPTVSEPKPKTLTYNGSAQELVTEGTATGGEMRYALGADTTTAPTEGWGTSIPTGTDAGTYYVWYKVKGDDNHADTTPVCIPVTIRTDEKETQIVEKKLTTVPKELEDKYSSIKELKNALLRKLSSKGMVATEENSVFYDVELKVRRNGGSWVPATEKDFEDGPLTVIFKYPAGTGMNTHNFKVAHMFTVKMRGHKPGEIEIPPLTKLKEGIQVELDGLSPVAISWDPVINSLPHTGDTERQLFYGLAVLVAFIGIGLLIKKK